MLVVELVAAKRLIHLVMISADTNKEVVMVAVAHQENHLGGLDRLCQWVTQAFLE
jgi:hypothetical protein